MINKKQIKILTLDDEVEYTQTLFHILSNSGYAVKTSNSPIEAFEMMKNESFDVVITDLMMPTIDGIQVLKHIKEYYPKTQVIIITGYGTIENAVEAIKKGALTYFIKGHDPENLLQEIENIKSMKEEGVLKNLDNEKQFSEVNGFLLETKSKVFAKTLEIAQKAAKSNVNILILGESGVGKEVFARFIHDSSRRSSGSFVPINCHSFSESLLESELFGHEKGAFTGAAATRIGRFETADGGTLFLDEIGDTSLDTQVKLLRVLESKSIQKVGSNASKKLDFRLVSATNQNLQEEITLGNFREDFFYRISSIVIRIPPLRARKEDLESLIAFFMKKAQKEQMIKISNMEPEVKNFLLQYDYPGNVRELKNIIERLVVLSEDGVITKDTLPICTNYEKKLVESRGFEIKPLKDIRKDFEIEYIQKVLHACSGNLTEAARHLAISRRQLFNKVSDYGLK
ncbi:sigma-54-dependent transcriptional regulator [Peribacillus huizhouensis]|uniref:DNA-binding NtrC family response regulator n=1 Tax=Peribacillus huizhouensis TaxID=1501239 RepID=A0ABR6CVC6_9BACI|nr:sigma-54 dependent transcriptional regulator [Peribacillus huizhouensis]MBA9028560.1 DNA-binding NtrC family response regulator [Peribacillus huizhouensis]